LELQEVIFYHHTPNFSASYSKLCSIVQIADVLTKMLQIGNDGSNNLFDVINENVLNKFELDLDRLIAILTQIINEIYKTKYMFDIVIGKEIE
jgi:hypothetical protein